MALATAFTSALVAAHAVQHLGGGDDHLAGAVGLLDHLLLEDGDLLHVHLHPQVPAGHHNAPGDGQDLVQVSDPLGVFDFGDDLHMPPAVFPQKAPDSQNVLGGADKGGRHKIEPLPDTEEQVLLIGIAKVGHGKGDAGDVNPLVVGDLAAVDHGAGDVGIGNGLHPQLHQAVINQDAAAGDHVPRESLVGDGSLLLGPHHLAGGEGKGSAASQLDAPPLKIPQANLRSLGIQQGGNGQPQLRPQLPHQPQLFQVLLVAAVGKVEAADVHSQQHHFAQGHLVAGGWAKGADNLCFSHIGRHFHSIHNKPLCIPKLWGTPKLLLYSITIPAKLRVISA